MPRTRAEGTGGADGTRGRGRRTQSGADRGRFETEWSGVSAAERSGERKARRRHQALGLGVRE